MYLRFYKTLRRKDRIHNNLDKIVKSMKTVPIFNKKLINIHKKLQIIKLDLLSLDLQNIHLINNLIIWKKRDFLLRRINLNNQNKVGLQRGIRLWLSQTIERIIKFGLKVIALWEYLSLLSNLRKNLFRFKIKLALIMKKIRKDLLRIQKKNILFLNKITWLS